MKFHRLFPALLLLGLTALARADDPIPPQPKPTGPVVKLPLEVTQPDPTKLVALTPEIVGGGVPGWYFPNGGVEVASKTDLINAFLGRSELEFDEDAAWEFIQKYLKKGSVYFKLKKDAKPGSYRVFAYVGNEKKVVSEPLDAAVCKVTFGKGTPNPPGPPDPPNPPPDGLIAAFAVVEDTSKAEQARGAVISSPIVKGIVLAQKLKWRLISTKAENAEGQQTEEVKYLLGKAQGKELPYLMTFDKAGVLLTEGKAPMDPEAFAKALGAQPPHKRAMGNIPPPDGKTKAKWLQYGDSPNVPIIPRDKWVEVNLEQYLPPVKDQDGIGACNAFASTTVLEACRIQAGLPPLELSPGLLYGAINGGQDQGSMLEDALAWLIENGTCTAAKVGPLEWQKGRRASQNKTGSEMTEAKSYRIIEAYQCPSFDAMASALQMGFFIDEGLMWHDNFKPDGDGWLPTRGGGGGGGHALCGYGLKKRNGVWGIMTRNSWGNTWGVNGNCIIPESLFGQQIGGYWCARAVVSTPTDFPYPKGQVRLPGRGVKDFMFALAY